jgi:methyl-accepting chemotaxis protein
MPLPPTSACDCAAPQGNILLAEGPRMMVAEVVPVWQRHIEASRLAVESGIGDLLDSFSRLCKGVMAASQRTPGTASGDPAPAPLLATNTRQDRVLTQLLDAVDITHQRREQMLAQLAESLVQLDAIEADLRGTLPEDAAPLQRLDDTRSALALLSQQVAADTRNDHARQDQALVQARQSLVALAVERPEPERAACALQSLSTHIEKDLERVLLGMQFQDRLNQTLTNVAHDMQRFTDWMHRHEHASHADAVRWLAELEHSYTMQEQRTRHHGRPDGDAPSQGGSVEFF